MSYTRRDFGRIALAALPAGMLFERGEAVAGFRQGKPNSKWAGVQVGMNVPYNFKTGNYMTADAIIAKCQQLNVSGLELRAHLPQPQLDQPLTAQERDRVLAYLRSLGALNQSGQYRGSSRRGGEPPVAIGDLFGGIPGFYVQTDWSSQPTMMQVAGGMDRLPAALAARLGNRITYRATVREIRQSERGVWIVYADAKGQPRRVDADYCISTIPLPALADVRKDLSQPVRAAIAVARYDTAGKIGLQFERRFWEQDDEIYGGRSWTDQEVGQIIYPSHGFTTGKGVLVGYYLDFRGAMRKRPPAEIQRLALEHGARVHPQYQDEFESVFSVTWARVPCSRGSWRSESSAAHEALAPLREPDGRVHFAGD